MQLRLNDGSRSMELTIRIYGEKERERERGEERKIYKRRENGQLCCDQNSHLKERPKEREKADLRWCIESALLSSKKIIRGPVERRSRLKKSITMELLSLEYGRIKPHFSLGRIH